MTLEERKVLVVGTGKSGIAATNLLEKVGAIVTLYDSNDKETVDNVKHKLQKGSIANIIIGELTDDIKKSIDLVVLSPGVPTDLEFVNAFRDSDIPIWGEVELAYQLSKGKILAITGTNGKTTTTALVGEIMKTYFESVFVVGNIGIPYTDMVLDMNESSVTVAEMSSFQLETIHDFKPNVSAILNITPDHLNRHHTLENYISAKVNITKNQGKEETCVLNYEDSKLRQIGETLNTNVIYFSSQRKLEKGIYLQNENIYHNLNGTETLVCNIHELNIIGTHSYENAMAGIAMALMIGVPIEYIKKAITAFKAVEHRIEYVTTIKGVKYYNDSKGTNPDAAIKGIQSMTTPTILIGGGYDKGSDYEEWINAFDNKVKYLILLGQTREKIATTAKKLGFHNIIMVENLKDAVEVAASKSEPGESVLLSPACASWGMFKSYEERGTLFKEYVNNLKE
ncbi:UDP-N-acetylmuramoyl-L-alanine--D-glutamate ligase [Anaeromicropila herbilytica]|uniref:UDP-N-acetylmuramoylalanine--D-glutamate ligase n=1 Tax=Anaeromicropila herbilytica TaxID=2785025 RepID=A0A7R7IEX1_9FIRM|nr:UDP-N-acetylmuramoyl-L-alanine--D-glutamate ligase [Anaeromicropila herbilytica]BCN31553.1 UDP-N-acetylmuramoylalanine--D-glutamate ligase [Anaeromicropila herbilytica]